VIDGAEIKSLKIRNLDVERLRAAEITVTDSLEVPSNPD
jgi:hypothetical protein